MFYHKIMNDVDPYQMFYYVVHCTMNLEYYYIVEL